MSYFVLHILSVVCFSGLISSVREERESWLFLLAINCKFVGVFSSSVCLG